MISADREQVASVLMTLGYDVNRKWQFAARDERTPSAYINANGTIHDYGSGWHGDLADFLKDYKGLSNSLQEARRLLGLPITLDFKDFSKANDDRKNGFITNDFIVKFAVERKANFARYSELLKGLLPSVKDAKKRKAIAVRYEIGYSKMADRLIMPIRDENSRIVTLWKYNPTFAKDKRLRYTKGRGRYAFNLDDLKRFSPDRQIMICEGEKDVLNAIANGYRAVTPGSASVAFKPEHLRLFNGFNVVICGDYDEAGLSFNKRIKAQLEPIAKSVTILQWGVTLGSNPKKGYDFTDYLRTIVN
jgi:DNA primase